MSKHYLRLFFLVVLLPINHVYGQTPQEVAEGIDAQIVRSEELMGEDPESGVILGRQTYENARGIGNDSLVVKVGRLMSRYYFFTGVTDSSMWYAQKYIEAADRIQDSVNMARGYNNLGLMFSERGNFALSIENYTQSLELKELMGDDEGVAKTYTNIGRAFSQGGLKQGAQAKGYLLRSLELKSELNMEEDLPSTYLNLAEVYQQVNQMDSVFCMMDSAVFFASKYPENGFYVQSLLQYGNLLIDQKDYDRALDFLVRAKNISDQTGKSRYVAEIIYGLGLLNERTNNLRAGLQYARQSWVMFQADESVEGVKKSALLLADIYQRQGQKDSTIKYQEVALAMADSVLNSNLEGAFIGIELSAQAAESRRRAQEDAMALQMKTQQIERSRTLTYFLALTLFLMITLGLVLYNRYVIKQRTTRELEVRNREILAQKEEIESQRAILEEKNEQLQEAQHIIRNQNNELTNVNAQLEQKVRDRTADLNSANENLKIAIQDLDRFIYKTSHDIRGPLARLMGLCSLALLDVKDEKSVQYFSMLDITAKSLNSVLVRLITINEINNSKIKPEAIDFSKIQEEVVQSVQRLEAAKEVSLNWTIPESTFESDYNLMLLIVGNLVENGVKFRNTTTRESSFVKIHIREEQKHLVIDVEDNGIGIPDDEKGRLKKMFTKSVENYEISGLGLYLVKLSVEKLEGSVAMVEDEGGLTKIRITLPLEYSNVRLSV